MSMQSEASRRRLEHQYPLAQPLQSDSSRNISTDVDSEQGMPSRTASISTVTESTPQRSRNLPARTVTDENLDQAYADFILYCNPTIPLDTNTSELKQIFRAPPRSDGKNFSTFTLFELIKKLESKELKTWAQLALDLGVEPPAIEKRQSAQKVQQYAVRLKRWMHAMHVDAFFEYLMNKPHVYWTQIPSSNDASPGVRDGVASEEDLAIRALLPETRPKRGRRKAEDRDDNDLGKSPSQRPRLDSPSLTEEFMSAGSALIPDATPATAHPDFQNFQDNMAPWSAIDTRGSGPTTFRWPPPQSLQTPLSAYPQSAITPRTQLWNDADDPRSAITPKSRSRRRHGPAVSSAWRPWPSNGTSSSGKLRGRPPSNRSVTDGPFSTFPANPASKDVPTISLRDTPTATPVVSNSEMQQFFPSTIQINPPNPQPPAGRPSRLSLQVPQRQGGNVRLATPPPPPVVLVNGQDDTSMQVNSLPDSQQIAPMMEYFNASGETDFAFGNFVTFAFRQNEDTDRTNMDALESHFICEILAAEWFDSAGANIDRCTIDEADQICKQVIKNLKAESSSTEAFLINLSALAGGPLMTRLRMTRLDKGSAADYECHWKMRFGSIEGDFTIRVTVQHGVELRAQDEEAEVSEETWKKRYLDLQQRIKVRDSKVGKLKRGMLDALVSSNEFSSI